jgi:hypothetical protein
METRRQTKLCIYATTFQSDIQAFTLHAAAHPEIEVLLVVESETAVRSQAVSSLLPLNAIIVERDNPKLKAIARGFAADVVVIDNHVPAFKPAPRVLILWHGYGWRIDHLSQMLKELGRHWGDVTRSNPNVLWAAFGEVDREYRISHSLLHPDNVAALGSPFSDLLLPSSAFQRAFSREAASRRYSVDVVNRKNVILALTWHHGSALGNLGDDRVLFDRLFADLDAKAANVIMRMHDRFRFEPDLLERFERMAEQHSNVQLKFKNECPDTLVDLSISDVMVSNYSSILNHFYFLERPTVHIDPADASGRYTDFQWKRGKLRKRVGAEAKDVWKLPPDEIGGLRAGSFFNLLDAIRLGLDEPDCCKEPARAFIARHYAAADGRASAHVLETMRQRWNLP